MKTAKFLQIIAIIFISINSLQSVAREIENCSLYGPSTKEHAERISKFTKTICSNEAECKEYINFDPQKKWQSCLSIGETILLLDYTQTYGALNQFKLLEEVIKRLPKTQALLYRGTSPLKDSLGNVVKLTKGSEYVLPRFVSTSLNQAIAEEHFANGVVMIINAKSARDIREYTVVKDEEEHILLSGTKLRVDRVYSKVLPGVSYEGEMQDEMKVTVYEMTEI